MEEKKQKKIKASAEAGEVWTGYFFSLMIISGETLESGADARRPRPKAKGVYMSIWPSLSLSKATQQMRYYIKSLMGCRH
ncbi:hypothetical protein C7123_03925 [Tannerella serpentiformis]|nr:hypothetical protein BCB71_08935 [Tannerella serpentiformis]AVV52937.1 hypothetical protein C7123_03925 [Tannerella serpentiformis]